MLAMALLAGFVSSAHAATAVDIILKPGEARSVFIDAPQAVNVACVDTATPPPPPPPPSALEFSTSESLQASFCEVTAGILSRLEGEDPTSVVGAMAECDVVTKKIKTKFWGVRAGAQTNFIARLERANCAMLSWVAKDIREMTSPASTIKSSYQCRDGNPDIWVKVSVTRFQ